MGPFLTGHATHSNANIALALAAAQIDAQLERRAVPFQPTLGWVYLTEALSPQVDDILAELRRRWPRVHWVGNVALGVMAGATEYIDSPALVLMLADLPSQDFAVFNGVTPPDPRCAHSALVHADPASPDLDELITDMSHRTDTGYLFGGLSASRHRQVHLANGVFSGGLSGVGFAPGVSMVSRVTQGCQPLGPVRRITEVDRNLITRLDDEPALPLLLKALGVRADEPRRAMTALHHTLVGLTYPGDAALARGGQFGVDTRVRPVIGVDPRTQGFAISDGAGHGHQLAFCRRDADAARRDLVRICAEIRDELAGDGSHPRRIAGAVYVSCCYRTGTHFGAPSAEVQIVQHALGDVPLVGFFAGGEIAHHHLYSYTGVLTVFATP